MRRRTVAGPERREPLSAAKPQGASRWRGSQPCGAGPAFGGACVFSAAGEPRDSREELHAEFEALLLGDRLEIESHAAYLVHWVELLKESPRVLLEVLSEGRQGADLNSAGASPPCVA